LFGERRKSIEVPPQNRFRASRDMSDILYPFIGAPDVRLCTLEEL